VRLSIPLTGGVLSPRYMGRAVIHHYSHVSAINATWTAAIMVPSDYSGVTSISYSHNVFFPLCSWARMSGLSILVCVCNALNLGVEFFLLFSHQIRELLSFLFPFRSFLPISNQYSDKCPCRV
jgi:hypothetical protein